MSRALLEAPDVGRVIDRIAHQLLEKTGGARDVVVLGIPTRGATLAHRLVARVKAFEGIDVPVGTLDVTPWMQWSLGCLTRAIEGAHTTLAGVMTKARVWETLRDVSLNERQRLVINRLLDGFEGKLTTSKWATLAKCSTDTALRDIQQLVERGVLVRNEGGGRSTSYSLAAR